MSKAVASSQTLSSPESPAAAGGAQPKASQQQTKAGPINGRKFGRPRGKTCCWTPELDELLKAAWARGGLRAARRAFRQEQPTWSWCSIRKRAAALGLCRPKPRPWSDTDVNHLLWSIDSNASLALIAERLGRTVAAIRKRLWDLGYKAESLGGYKVKEVADMICVPPGTVQYWVDENMLITKGGRITESSLSKFLSDCPEKIPYKTLSREMRSWLREMGYPNDDKEPKAASTGAQQMARSSALRSTHQLRGASRQMMDSGEDEREAIHRDICERSERVDGTWGDE